LQGRLEWFSDREESVRIAKLHEEAPGDKMVVVSKVNYCGVLEFAIQSETRKRKPEAQLSSGLKAHD
jgi:hypothetical protein